MKKLTGVLLAVCLALSLTACSGSSSEDAVEIDINELAEALLPTVTSDSLSKTADELIPSIYFLEEDDIISAVAYTSAAVTSCEVTVIESADADGTAAVRENMQKRVDDQKALYATYNESEAARLETALIKGSGPYAVLCVCDDPDEAESILKEYGF